MNKLQQIQQILGVTPDGKWGPKSQAALELAKAQSFGLETGPVHHVKASSFADPTDVAAFKRCKAKGKSDQECFKVGDNAIGCWGDSTAEGTGPSCALPPEDMEEKWGSVAAAKQKRVQVTANGRTIVVVLKDRMPRRANIRNGAGIDLNPDAVRALGLQPPIMLPASWQWS